MWKGQDVSKDSSLVFTSDGSKIKLKRVGSLRAAENFVERESYEKVGEVSAHEKEWARFQKDLLKLDRKRDGKIGCCSHCCAYTCTS